MNNDEWPTWARLAGRMGFVLLCAIAFIAAVAACGIIAAANFTP